MFKADGRRPSGNGVVSGALKGRGQRPLVIRAVSVAAVLALTATAQYLQQGSKLVASGTSSLSYQGYSVGLSSDGNTAVVGAPADNNYAGGAFIYVRSNGQWTQQGTKLFGTGATIANPKEGYFVAISGDGNTVILGSVGGGGAWIFTRSGTAWTQQAMLTPSDATASANLSPAWWSVALSGDGNTAMLGALRDNTDVGAAWIFTRTGTTWTQQGNKLVGSGWTGGTLAGARQGTSVALSADGKTAISGGYSDTSYNGAAWVFTLNNGTWQQQGSKLVGTGANGAAEQGVSVSLSSDGNTAAVGGPFDNTGAGAIWIFTRSGTTWTQQGKLIASGESGPSHLGQTVDLAADGNTLVSGGFFDSPDPVSSNGDAVGAVWVFKRAGNVWGQFGNKFVGSDRVGFSVQGLGAAISGAGDTIMSGGPNDNSGFGAAWPFVFSGTSASIFIYDAVGGNAYTGLSTGTGTFTYVHMPATTGFDILRHGNITGGGKTDLILYNSSNALGYTLLSNGDGTYHSVSLFWGPGFKTVAAGDLNGDGKTDFLIYRSTDGTSYTALSNGDGTFSYKYTLVSPGFTHMALADFSGDGKADVFYYNSKTGAAYLGISDGTGGFSFSPVALDAGYNFVETGDINADGKADLVLYAAAPGSARIGLSDGAGFTFTPESWTPGFTTVKVFDFNGDGKADIALYNKTSTLGYLLVGDGTGNFTSESLFWGQGFDTVKALDLNGDGKQDVIIYNSTNGASYTGISSGVSTTNPFSYTYAYWGNARLVATAAAQP